MPISLKKMAKCFFHTNAQPQRCWFYLRYRQMLFSQECMTLEIFISLKKQYNVDFATFLRLQSLENSLAPFSKVRLPFVVCVRNQKWSQKFETLNIMPIWNKSNCYFTKHFSNISHFNALFNNWIMCLTFLTRIENKIESE